MSTRVILWGYNGSPFVRKAEILLTMKDIPHYRVDVPLKPPRPELADLLGISYRKVPVLAIGKDIYCDTSAISDAIESRFPPTRANPATLYPNRADGGTPDRQILKTFSRLWGDNILFVLGGSLVPWEKIPALKADRSKFFGFTVGEAMEKRFENNSRLQSNLVILEDQLEDGRTWIANTSAPGLIDASIYAFMSWLNSLRYVRENILLQEMYPRSLEWMNRFKNWITQIEQAGRGSFEKISAERAVELIKEDTADPPETTIDVVDTARWKLRPGYQVSVTPSDSGPVPTIGRLIGLDFKKVVLETKGSADVAVRVHFPRINYDLSPGSELAPEPVPAKL